MTSLHRWLIVALTTALAIGTPLTLRALPASDNTSTPAERLDHLRASVDEPYSGYVEALGTLQLPVADGLNELGPLFGERTRMRVWWNDPTLWRVDRLTATGEADLIRDGNATTRWEYEGSKVIRTREPPVRLPRLSDLLPPELARYLLSEDDASNVSALPSDRIAGRSALGLRVTPSDDRSSIDRVDVWIDEASGIPLRLSLFAVGSTNPALTSSFLDFAPGASSPEDFDFRPPRGSAVERQQVVDVADAANRFAPFRPPTTVADLPRSPARGLRGVAVYGSGLTQVLVVPLWDDIAGPLRNQLLDTPTVVQLTQGPALSVGPLNVLLTRFASSDGGWLIAGTVTAETLDQIAIDLRGARVTPPTVIE